MTEPDASAGLTRDEAARRLAQYGANNPVQTRRLSAVRQIAALFANPLVAILLAASGISAAVGQRVDAALIAVIVLLSVSLNFWQSYRSAQAAERLRQSVAPTATVRRDGVWGETPIGDVVPGDVVRLSAGDLVPADAELLDGRDLAIQESSLTGESLPVDKAPGGDAQLYQGTSVVSGTGVALVRTTGPRTRFGEVAARLAERAPETEFERSLRHFSLLILRTTVALVLFILLVGIATKGNPLQSLLFAVALGVGLTPEFLPMIATVTLGQGAARMARRGVVVKRLAAIQNLGSVDVLCSDKTGTITAGAMSVEAVVDASGAASERPMALARVNSALQTGLRSPLDAAILGRRDPTAAASPSWTLIDEVPFDFERRRLSVVVAPQGGAGERLLVTKGAPESVLPCATRVEVGAEIRPLDDATRAACREIYARLSATGFRVLAIAWRTVDVRDAYGRADEADLVLAGFIGFADPVLPEVAGAIDALRRDGVAVKIITGDNELVARHVCEQLGVAVQQITTGDEVARLDDAALAPVAEQTALFARMTPAQKNRVILALKRRGHVVAYMGDGINDAPSLHTADVGISVTGATDVARAAADVILSTRSLIVLHEGILEGRRAAGNLMKYLLMGTSSNFGNMLSMAVASAFLPFLPMLPTQVLLNNFLYDLAQVTIPSDRVDREYLSRPQRWDLGAIRDFMLFVGPISSAFDFLTFFVLLRVLHADAALFHTGWFVESLATQTLVLFVIRTRGAPWRSRPSGALVATTLAIAAIGVILPATPLAAPLGFTLPSLGYLGFVLAATVVYLAAVEGAKRVLVRRSR